MREGDNKEYNMIFYLNRTTLFNRKRYIETLSKKSERKPQ